MTDHALQSRTKRPRGRPRRLELDQLIDAAIAMGLTHLDMDALADKLGVAAGTVYGYVRSRDELIGLAAGRILERPLVLAPGATWQDAVREMAESSFEVLLIDRGMLAEFVKGTYSTRVGDAYQAAMIEFLQSQGFSRAVALDLYYEVGQAVVGAAIAQLHVRTSPELVIPSETLGDYTRTLERIIAGYEDDHANR